MEGLSRVVLPGQLCVIVGLNGSGKSTILKLGSILIDGHDIKTLRLAVLRRAVAILFQDCTHFPLSVRANAYIPSPKLANAKFLGRKVVEGRHGFKEDTADRELSGGQMQRLAVARTFMRSSTMEQEVGLHEPSASLDPAAEHDRFSRLRKLRGNKTMIFSTHCFGSLTRHADIILYMNDSAIVEAGTHEELLKHEDSDYGRLWRMQAEAFL
ncbi:P-loop containing nucleoside triphosphate hydrolase protein [Lactarius pseudohatsudake]|nr:P-loop containing nucleoside triphosphate hydrolase protein [Lactarius pseudohatsudake]